MHGSNRATRQSGNSEIVHRPFFGLPKLIRATVVLSLQIVEVREDFPCAAKGLALRMQTAPGKWAGSMQTQTGSLAANSVASVRSSRSAYLAYSAVCLFVSFVAFVGFCKTFWLGLRYEIRRPASTGLHPVTVVNTCRYT